MTRFGGPVATDDRSGVLTDLPLSVIADAGAGASGIDQAYSYI